MLVWILGIIIVLHGLVHLLYAAHAYGALVLQPDMPWPQHAWGLSRAFKSSTLGTLAVVLCSLSGLGIAAGGIAYLLKMPAWQTLLVAFSILSTATYLLLWDGKRQDLDNQGIYAVVIDLALIAAILLSSIPLPA